jgi:hypothetical protein
MLVKVDVKKKFVDIGGIVCHCVLFYLYFIFDNINENISNFASFK